MMINYPYIPTKKGSISYVSSENLFMEEAKATAREQSLDLVMPTGVVIVKDGKIIGRGANGSNYHETHGCERVKQGVATGQGYDLCEGCHPKNHAEPKAVNDALSKGLDLSDATLYLWGHWWCCESCWEVMLSVGIRTVYLLSNSECLFNKQHPDNIVGKQFD